jgi:putative spermidine/putrescine transport system permease protein
VSSISSPSLAGVASRRRAAPAAGRPRGGRSRPRIWRVSILTLALLFFIGPLLCAFKFSLLEQSGSYGFANYVQIIKNSALRDALFTSLEISVVTAVVVVGLTLPTVVLVRLKLPKLAILMDTITLLPLVIPPVVMADGLESLQAHSPGWLEGVFNHPLTGLAPFYVILAMPLVYRAIDTGVRSIDLHTLVDASRSLGAGWTATLVRVILPNVRTAVLGGMFLTVALCLGEAVIASFLLYTTFPTEMIEASQTSNSANLSVALSVFALLFTFLLLFLLSFFAGRRGGKSFRVI